MNEPAPADEGVVENEPGAEPELSFDPHVMGRDVEPEGDEAKPKADDEPKDPAAAAPADEEGDLEPTEPDDADAKIRKRVGELAFENRQLKRELEQARTPADSDEPPEPLKTLKDFDYDEAAFNAYLVEEITTRTTAAVSKQTATDSAQDRAQQAADEFAAREAAFDAEHEGFSERLHAEDLMITQEMAVFITDPESEVGLHVGDYLSQNKPEAARIAAMSPAAQMREMTKLETRIGKNLAKAKAEKDKTSDAPSPPANAIDGTDPGVTRDPSDPATADGMSDDEWLRARNKQVHGK